MNIFNRKGRKVCSQRAQSFYIPAKLYGNRFICYMFRIPK
jgi:hypothetical protein